MIDSLLEDFGADLVRALDKHLNRKVRPARHIGFALLVYVRGGASSQMELVTNDNIEDAERAVRTWLTEKED